MKRKTHNLNLRSIHGERKRTRSADELAESRPEKAFDSWGKFEATDPYPPVTVKLNDGTIHYIGQEPEIRSREG